MQTVLRLLFGVVMLCVVVSCFSQETDMLAKSAPHRYLVIYRNFTIDTEVQRRVQSLGGRVLQRHERMGVVSVAMNGATVQQEMASLRAQPLVDAVVPDYVLHAHVLETHPADVSVPQNNHRVAPLTEMLPSALNTDALYHSPSGWAITQAGGTPSVWNQSSGQAVRIAVLDSGVDSTHPDIGPKVIWNMSEVDQTAVPSPCDDGSPADQEGHGTWAASLAAASAGDGTGPLVGIAPQAQLMNIKVMQRMPGSGTTQTEQCENGQASGLLSWMIQGIDDAVAQHADIISLSMGSIVDLYTGDGAGAKALVDRATHAAAAAGVVVVAALGNDGFDFSDGRYAEIPAMSRDVVAVIASTNAACREDVEEGAVCVPGAVTMPYYSNHGTGLNAVAAPGGSYPRGGDGEVSGWVTGACSQGVPGTADGLPTDTLHSLGCFNLGHQQYVQAIGTSASAPIVAGVAALLKAIHPDWSATKIADVLRSSGSVSARMPYPQVNAAAALSAQ